MKKVAFICVHNSCRSQIAEALGKHLAANVFESYSAGTETKPQINQDAVRIMKELYGIDMEETQHSKLLADIPDPDIAISMGCNVGCPFIGRDFDANWGLEDPTGKSDEEFKVIIREIEKQILKLKLTLQIEAYEPVNEQEEKDKKIILNWINTHEDAFTRANEIAHVTTSGWTVNKDHTKVLMVYHNIYNSWSWLGGHADGEMDLLSVAIREVQEEAGLVNVKPVSEDVYSLEVLTVDGHVRKGRYVPSHLHMNITYLLEADESEQTSIKEDENSGVAWFTPQEALERSTEPWFVENVYKKLMR